MIPLYELVEKAVQQAAIRHEKRPLQVETKMGVSITWDGVYPIAFVDQREDRLLISASEHCKNLPSPPWLARADYPPLVRVAEIELANPACIDLLASLLRQAALAWKSPPPEPESTLGLPKI